MDPETSIDASVSTEAPPPDSPVQGPSIRCTWGLGAVATALCGLLGLSGLVLMFYYRPEPTMAALSLLDLEATSSLAFLRDVHFWGSRALVAVVWLHLFRVLVREAYRPPRHRIWLVGVGLLFLTLALAHTGSLLPRENTARGADALLAMYVLHCAVLPTVFFAGILWHLWRVRQDDGGAS